MTARQLYPVSRPTHSTRPYSNFSLIELGRVRSTLAGILCLRLKADIQFDIVSVCLTWPRQATRTDDYEYSHHGESDKMRSANRSLASIASSHHYCRHHGACNKYVKLLISVRDRPISRAFIKMRLAAKIWLAFTDHLFGWRKHPKFASLLCTLTVQFQAQTNVYWQTRSYKVLDVKFPQSKDSTSFCED